MNLLEIRARLSRFDASDYLSLVLGLSFAAGLSMLLGIGPSLQTYSLAMLTSDHVDAYSMVNGEELVLFPTLSEWIFNQYLAVYFLLSVGFLYVVRNSVDARTVFVNATIFFLLVLTSLDVFHALMYFRDNFWLHIFQCVVANLVGSPLIAGFIVLVGHSLSIILPSVRPQLSSITFIALLLPLGVGGILNIAAYYVSAVLFKPTPTAIDAVIASPVRGSYIVKEPQGSNRSIAEQEKTKRFGLFTGDNSYNALVWGKSLDESINISWGKSSTDSKFSLRVFLLSGCVREDAAKIAASLSPQFQFDNVLLANFSTDTGFSRVDAYPDQSESIGIRMKNGDVNDFFIVESDKDKEKFSVGRILHSPEKIQLWSNYSGYYVYLSSYLVGSTADGRAERKARSFTFMVDSVHYELRFEDNEGFDYLQNPECRGVALTGAMPRSVTAVPKVDGLGGVLIHLTRERTPLSIGFGPVDVLEVGGVQGWVGVTGLSVSDLEDSVSPGFLSQLAFGDGGMDLKLNNVKIESSSRDEFSINGADLNGTKVRGGKLQFRGDADHVWQNGKRFSKTRWERFDSAIKLLLISGMFTLLSSLFYVVVTSIREKRSVRFY